MQSAKIYALSLILLILGSSSSYGQYIVKKASGNSTNTSLDGFYYAIPQTVLKIDLVIEKIKQIPGPLANYAEDYLGVTDYISTNSQSAKLLHATITPLYQADPEQYYYVQFPAERSKDEKATSFQLTGMGTLLGFGSDGKINNEIQQTSVDQTFIMFEGDEDFSYYADYNRKKKIDTVVRKISIDTVTINRFLYKTSWVDKTDKEKANEAAQYILELREARFHLISGYQEVSYGESMKYMNNQLKELENLYLELFLGKEVKTTDVQSVYYVPKKDKITDVLYSTPDNKPIEIKLDVPASEYQLPDKPLEKIDNLYYRVPQTASVKITQDDQTYLSANISISQFGVLATAPLNRTRLLFDPQTGNLINIIRE
ncbi:MAG: DUF4831 family protein [Bacteroidetes bacterium]|nr:DUF4831 family protein [Bacteroidota bacterium]